MIEGIEGISVGRPSHKPICKGCGKFPNEIYEYTDMAEALQITPDEYVKEYEDTYDPRLQKFFCTDCWVKAGCPVQTPEGMRLLSARPVWNG